MWNPFSKLANSKQRFLSAPELQEFERQRNDVIHTEKICKKLQHDMKEYSNALQTLTKTQTRLPQSLRPPNMLNESLSNMGDIWNKAVVEEERLNQDYLNRFQIVAAEPVKRFNSTFPLFHNGIKKWENTLQQTTKEQEKVEKYRDKEKNQQNIAKLELHSKGFEQSKQEFELVHARLSKDVNQFCNSRKDYFDPTVDALVNLQIEHNKQLEKLYSNLCAQLQADNLGGSDEVYKNQMMQKLNSIKSLSIVAE